MIIETWTTITLSALLDLWKAFVDFLPRLVGSLIIFLIGWFLAIVVKKIIAGVLVRLKFNTIFERTGWQEALEKAEIKTKPSDFIGEIGKWIVAIVFLVAAIKVLFLGYGIDLRFLDEIVSWLPNLIIAVIIFIVATVIGDILGKIVQASARKTGVRYAQFLGTGVRWIIYIVATLMILRQLGVTPSIIDAIVMGFVGIFMLAFGLGLGLAFGLGGKEIATKILEDLKKKLSE